MALSVFLGNDSNDDEVACLSGNEKNLLDVDFQVSSGYNKSWGQWSGAAKIQLPSDALVRFRRSP